jgi:acetyl/propionyl-CoA carboxylase alpha subunit
VFPLQRTVAAINKLLIANRGEIAVRIARTAQGMGITSLAVYSEYDAQSTPLNYADSVKPLRGQGVAAYLDIE